LKEYIMLKIREHSKKKCNTLKLFLNFKLKI